jgi:L,D-peptidoglycan transpeptidase YkuD (ErfK/YbiS/YcfS/YnhG family)
MDIVVASPTEIIFLEKTYSCVVGRGGIGIKNGEGDGITPVGRYPLRSLRYRPDLLSKPQTYLPTHTILPQDGWCDDPNHIQYNRPIRLPFHASHEILWRSDPIYNLIIDLGFNDSPPIPGLGSALFIHVKSPTASPTAGCIALTQNDLLDVLQNCSIDTFVQIKDCPQT